MSPRCIPAVAASPGIDSACRDLRRDSPIASSAMLSEDGEVMDVFNGVAARIDFVEDFIDRTRVVVAECGERSREFAVAIDVT